MELNELILNWYIKHKRDLPWRETADPYRIWLSEVILQQTRVEQGLPYYLRFTGRYKTVRQLAAANDDEVMKLWQGLGYYNRAANMLKTARLITKEHKGVFPGTYEELIRLKGVGPYTAAAIASIAYNEARAVVDGNVYRVLARLFAISEPINSTTGKKLFAGIADQVLNRKHPGMYNQGIMELGATVCKPRQPSCVQCPVQVHCRAFSEKTIADYPVKLKANKPVDRFLSYFYIDQNKRTFITQRMGKNIWKGLYELPNIESGKALQARIVTKNEAFRQLFGHSDGIAVEHLFSARHQLSHQTIYADFFRLTSDRQLVPNGDGYIRVKLSDLETYAVPRLFDKFLNYLNLHSD
jgi:A/G-specific adenine glycosylase